MPAELRPAESDAELQRYIDLVASLYPEQALTVEEIRASQRDAESVHLLALERGTVVGTGACVKDPGLRARRGAYTRAVVVPGRRRRGHGSAVYAALSEWARRRDVAELETYVRDDEPESLDWAVRRGFRESRREGRLELVLAQVPVPEVAPPDGVEIVSLAERPGFEGGMYEVALEAYADEPGTGEDEIEPYEDWLAHDIRGPGDRAEATFVALAGDEVVGYAKFSLTRAQPEVAYHDLTGVKRAWRRRGIAGALKRAEIAWAKETGYERLSTMNEERNEPIRRLNERLGYQPAPGRIWLRRPLTVEPGSG